MAMNRRRWMVVGTLGVFVALVVLPRFFTHNTPSPQPPLGFIDAGSLGTLRADFNRAASEVRIIVLLSPT
jgi:hypothetical protein